MRTFTKILAFIFGAGIIVAGAYFLFKPELIAVTITQIIGIVLILDAIIKMVDWFSWKKDFDSDGFLLFSAILSLIFGVLLAANGAVQFITEMAVAYVIAIWILISGVVRVLRAFTLKDLKGKAGQVLGKRWWVLLIFGIIMIALGLVLLCNPVITVTATGALISIAMIFVGANLLTFSVAA